MNLHILIDKSFDDISLMLKFDKSYDQIERHSNAWIKNQSIIMSHHNTLLITRQLNRF